jgi:DNA-directed RNA polymerase specialized sigma subunit
MQATFDVIDEADRTILLMKYQDNMMVKEIVEILNLSESAVKCASSV